MGEKKQIRISVKDKIACLVDKEQFLVCGNNDYEVVFDFDSDWEGISAKTAVFVYGNTPVHKPFVGNVCEGIEIKNATLCAIGVFAGDIKTTTGATIECRQSIRDIGGVPKPPSKEVYDEIMALLDKAIEAHTELPVGGKAGQVLKKVSDKDYDTAWEDDKQRDLTEIEEKIESLDTAVKQNAEGITNKLDKTTEANKIYGTDENGEQKEYPLAVKYTDSGIVKKVGGGYISMPAPTQDWHGSNKEYTDKKDNEVKAYADSRINPLEERVSDLENLTLSYHEITSTDYEKAVPADVGKPARVKMIGGATEKVVSKNILNPKDIGFDSDITTKYNDDGTITYTLHDWTASCWFDLWNFPVGKYYIYLENASIGSIYEANIDIVLASDYHPETNPEGTTTRTLKAMVWQDTSVTTDTYEILEAPADTVFEPYHEPYFQHAEVERIESIGANLFDGSLVKTGTKAGLTIEYDSETQIFTLNGTTTVTTEYAGTYINLKGEKGKSYLVKTEIVGGVISKPSGSAAVAFFGSADAPNTYNNWSSSVLASSVGRVLALPHEYITYFWFYIDSGVTFKDYKVKVMLARVDKNVPYEPYSAEPIDSIAIPVEAIKARVDGFGLGENYIQVTDNKFEFVQKKKKIILNSKVGAWAAYVNQTSNGAYVYYRHISDKKVGLETSDCCPFENKSNSWANGFAGQYSDHSTLTSVYFCTDLATLAEFKSWLDAKEASGNPVELEYELATPVVTDITDLFTEGNKLQVQRGGAIRFVNERKMAIPNTVAFIKRKE